MRAGNESGRLKKKLGIKYTCKPLCQLPHASNPEHSRFVSERERDGLSENGPRLILLWVYDELHWKEKKINQLN